MNQTSKIKQRESDYEIAFYRGEHELLKFYGTEPALMVLAEILKDDSTCNATIQAAVKMGII